MSSAGFAAALHIVFAIVLIVITLIFDKIYDLRISRGTKLFVFLICGIVVVVSLLNVFVPQYALPTMALLVVIAMFFDSRDIFEAIKDKRKTRRKEKKEKKNDQ